MLALAVTLVAENLGLTKVSEISIPATGAKVSSAFLWAGLLFLLIPYYNEIISSQFKPIYKFKKQFNSELCTWSRTLKSIKEPELVTPLINVSRVNNSFLVWSCLYHQAGSSQEPSYEAVSLKATTTKLAAIAFAKTFFNIKLLDAITLPIIFVLLAISTKAYVLW